ncbi:MAG: methyltransferase domain-containing protein [Candidatus Omnitrophota bacterium]
MKKILILSLGVLGFSSLISQVVVIRELAMSFYANEFFIGWILFCWFLGTALGSALGSRLFRDAERAFRSLAICHVLTAFLFPIAIVLIRSGKLILGTPAGALPEFIPALLYPLAVLAPLCGVMGIQFVVAVRGQESQMPEGESARTAGWAYFWECLGFIAGGTLFSFALVFTNEFRVAAILAVLNLAIACGIFHISLKKKKRTRWILVLTAILFPAWLLGSSISLQQQTSQLRFPNETLIRTENTVHGNVSVTQLGAQYNFYQSGLLLGADREDLASEYLVHFPMLAHPAPQKVLLLGTGFNGPLQQILKHGPQEVCAVELDPELLKITRGFLPEDLQAVLRDLRVRFRAADPRDFLKSEDGKFNVIIANFPDPASVLVNRNYTEQFFRSIRSHLSPGGVFSTHITFAANTMTPEQERLGSSVYATLSQVFPSVKVLPEDTLFFLASGEKTAFWGPEKMIDRLSERKIKPDFVTADQVRYRFTNDRVERVTTAFRNAIWKTKNTDLRPRTCYFEFLRWLSQFDPKIAEAFFFLAVLPFPVILAAGLFVVLILAVFTREPMKRARKLALVSMGTAGFSVMAFEIVVIYLFQAAFGDLYYRLAWVITAFMAGLGAGTWAAVSLKKIPERFALAMLHVMNAAFLFLLIKVCVRIFSAGVFLGEEYQYAFLGIAFWSGLVAGAIFPFANRFYFARGKGDRLGSVYAADLWGSALGALLTAGFFIPIWGVPQTLMFLGAANVLLVLLFLFRKDLGRKDL